MRLPQSKQWAAEKVARALEAAGTSGLDKRFAKMRAENWICSILFAHTNAYPRCTTGKTHYAGSEITRRMLRRV